MGYDVKLHERSLIKRKRACEIDLYFPDYKIGIEVDGIYWHSNNPYSRVSKPLNDSFIKIDLCEQIGVKLFRFTDEKIFEDFEAVTSLILSALGGEKINRSENFRWWSKYDEFPCRPEDDEVKLYKEGYRKYVEFSYEVAR